jgi:hypothetical protein
VLCCAEAILLYFDFYLFASFYLLICLIFSDNVFCFAVKLGVGKKDLGDGRA